MVCNNCANCCKFFAFEISGDNKKWIEDLASFVKFTRPDFMSIVEGNVLTFKAPCKFLVNDRCSIYADRPNICRNFLCRKAKQDTEDGK